MARCAMAAPWPMGHAAGSTDSCHPAHPVNHLQRLDRAVDGGFDRFVVGAGAPFGNILAAARICAEGEL